MSILIIQIQGYFYNIFLPNGRITKSSSVSPEKASEHISCKLQTKVVEKAVATTHFSLQPVRAKLYAPNSGLSKSNPESYIKL